jgi:hypothetical protein
MQWQKYFHEVKDGISISRGDSRSSADSTIREFKLSFALYVKRQTPRKEKNYGIRQ